MTLIVALTQNHAKNCFSGTPIAQITSILGLLLALGICKIVWKNVCFLFMDPLWKLPLPLCILSHAFSMTFSNFRNAFVTILLKNSPRSQKSHRTDTHKYIKVTVPARSVVLVFRHDAVLLESPTLNCMLYFSVLSLSCRSKLAGRRCCPAQRTFN